jgi:hypothetical protein
VIRYFHKYKKSDIIPTPRFEYTFVCEIRYQDKQYQLTSAFTTEDDPLPQRRKAMRIYGETRKIIEFLVRNGFFGEADQMEFTTEIFSRIGGDEIQILGAGLDIDTPNLVLEFETLKLFGFIPSGEPTMTLVSTNDEEVTILMTDIAC